MSSSYVCQKCRQPLLLDASLADLSPSSYDLLASTFASFPARSQQSDLGRAGSYDPKNVRRRSTLQGQDGVLKHPAPHRGISVLPTESFVYLQDSVVQKIPPSGVPSPGPGHVASTEPSNSNEAHLKSHSNNISPHISPLSRKLKSTNKLFSLLSRQTDLEHPLCTECTDNLLKGLNEQLKDTMRERDGYLAFEKELKKEKSRDEEPAEEIERRIERLKEEEKLAIEDIKEAQREKVQLDEELKALELEEKELEEEEAECVSHVVIPPWLIICSRFWVAHNTHMLTAADQVSQLASLRAAYAYDSLVLEKLERTNVYNDAFCIGHDGVFGTINGLRLGRVSGVHVRTSVHDLYHLLILL